MKQVLRQWGPRAVGLLVTAFGLYVVAPSVVALLGQYACATSGPSGS